MIQDMCIECGERKRAKNRPRCWSCYDKRRSPESQEQRRIQTNIRSSKWNQSNREHINDWRKHYRKEIKLIVLEMYGGKCNCCNELNNAFLTMDHINNDGTKQRKENLSQRNIFEYLLNKPIDQENFQVLCFNCNFGKQVNGGICPHQQSSQEAWTCR